jgi:hypothetical protein
LISGNSDEQQARDTHQITYEGRITGYAINGTVKTGALNMPTTLLGRAESTNDVLMYMSDDMKCINVYQASGLSDSQIFYEIKRVVDI